MSTVIIPAKKKIESETNLMNIDYIWDYVDFSVEESSLKKPLNTFCPLLDYEDYFEDEYDEFFNSCEDFNDQYIEDDWEWDYRAAFEDDPEAIWGIKW